MASNPLYSQSATHRPTTSPIFTLGQPGMLGNSARFNRDLGRGRFREQPRAPLTGDVLGYLTAMGSHALAADSHLARMRRLDSDPRVLDRMVKIGMPRPSDRHQCLHSLSTVPHIEPEEVSESKHET